MSGRAAHIIVVGNEKGGCGKTTVSMHLAVGLLRLGFKVGCIDLDHRQQSLGRYFSNRRAWMERSGIDLPTPTMVVMQPSNAELKAQAAAQEKAGLEGLLGHLARQCDFVVIDCPGSDVALARHAHVHADTLITPINDSLLDLDLLGRLDPVSWQLQAGGVYSNLVWELRKERRAAHRSGIDWLVTRSRLSALSDRNKQKMAEILPRMSKILGFRLADGFGERVIYRYLFLWGLTVLDMEQAGIDLGGGKSNQAARQEVISLLRSLWLPKVNERLDRL
ncbi:MAG: division plane positioning ATPase MipZ [Magnetospirillum sp.]